MFEIMFSDDNLQCDLWQFVDVKGDVSCNVIGDTWLMLTWC